MHGTEDRDAGTKPDPHDGAKPVLDLHLSDDQRRVYEDTLVLAAQTLMPLADRARRGRVNRPLVKALADHGLLHRLFADTSGITAIALCLIREALARVCTEADTAFALQGLGGYPIAHAGTPPLKRHWLHKIANGDAIAALTLAEPQPGSGIRHISLTATPDDNGYRLTGEKLWIASAPDADIYTVFARTRQDGIRGLTAFAVPADSPGLSSERRELLTPQVIGTLHFDAVSVPASHVLGRPGEGFTIAMRALDLFRPSVGALSIGMARAALDLAANAPQHGRRLADLVARTHAARLMVHEAAATHDAGNPDPALAAVAKILAAEVAQLAVDAAVDIHGPSALERGHPLEQLSRDVRAPRIYEAAPDAQHEIIARQITPQPARQTA